MAYDMWTSFYQQLWSESFWLPEGISWQDMKPTAEIMMPDSDDLWTYPLIIGTLILIFRIFIFIKVFHALGKYLGLSDKPISKDATKLSSNGAIKSNKESETLMKKHNGKKPKTPNPSGASQCDKFCTASFSLCYRVLYTTFGFIVLFDKPWATDIIGCWRDYPYHSLTYGLWWYYITGLSFYWSLLIWDFVNPPSKGKIAFYLHHIFTTTIIIFSWLCNITRAGSLIFFLHDICDIFLEASKICIYFELYVGLDIFFVMSLLSWLIFRNYYFGGVIIRSAIFEAYEYNFMPAAYLFFTLLLSLFALNMIWTYMFIIAGYRRITTGKYGADKGDQIDKGGKNELKNINKDTTSFNKNGNGHISYNNSSGDLYLTRRKTSPQHSKNPSKSPSKSTKSSSKSTKSSSKSTKSSSKSLSKKK